MTGRLDAFPSGRLDYEDFDLFLMQSEPGLLHEVAAALLPLVPPCDALAAVPLSGLPLATVLGQMAGKPLIFAGAQNSSAFVRSLDETMRGPRTVLVDDSARTGRELATAGRALRSAGLVVDTAVCVVDWRQGALETLARNMIELHALLSVDELTRALAEQ